MKKMRFLWVVLLCLAMALSVAACGKGNADVPSGGDDPAPAPVPEVQTAELALYLEDSHIVPDKTTKAVAIFTADGEEKEVAITFTTDNAAVATVDANGVLTAKAIGTVNVTAACEYGEKTYTATKLLTVAEVKALTTVESEIKPAVGGDAVKIRYEVYYNGQAVNTDEITYRIADTSVATVDGEGNVTAVTYGKTVLTLLYKELSTSLDVTVDTAHIGNAADFMKIADTLDKPYTYVLKEDIDLNGTADKFSWGADKCESYPTSFKGVFDGDGHKVTMTLNAGVPHATDSDPAFDICLFGKNEGTVKNTFFELSFIKANGRQNGLIKQNYGTVENVAYKASYVTGSDWDSMHVAAVIQNFGTVQNVVAIHDVGNVTNNNNAARGVYVVGANYQEGGVIGKGAARIQNCIQIVVNTSNYQGEINKAYKYADVGITGNVGIAAYTKEQFFTSVTELSGSEGWNDNWAVGDAGLGFAGKLLVAKIA